MHPQLLRPKSLQITKDNGSVPACADKLFSVWRYRNKIPYMWGEPCEDAQENNWNCGKTVNHFINVSLGNRK